MSLTRDQVRAIDRHATLVLGVPGVVLMENAGRGAADAIEAFLGGPSGRACNRLGGPKGLLHAELRSPVAGKAVAVVAGAGNNGGDGYVVARHLHIRGARPAVFLVAEEGRIAGDALVNLEIIRKLGLDIRQVSAADMGRLSKELAAFDLIVDAVGGTGIQGPLRGAQAAAVEQINAAGRPVVALDIPTGLDCDTGAADGPVIRAALTVTFAARKKGFDAPGAAAYTGKVVVADIGVPTH
jgi:NAD(P)H-hydrate epimerase